MPHQTIATFQDNFPRDCSSTGIGNYNYRVNRSESRATGVFVEVEFSVSSILEAQQWKTTFEEKNLIYLRKSHTRNSKKKSVLYKVSDFPPSTSFLASFANLGNIFSNIFIVDIPLDAK